MSTRDRIEKHISEAKTNYPFMADTLAAIAECYHEHGCPEESGGPYTGAGKVCALATLDSMGDGATEEDEKVLRDAEVALFEACGYIHVGGDEWHRQWEPDEQWDAFCEGAYEIASEYHASQLWEDFCNWRW